MDWLLASFKWPAGLLIQERRRRQEGTMTPDRSSTPSSVGSSCLPYHGQNQQQYHTPVHHPHSNGAAGTVARNSIHSAPPQSHHRHRFTPPSCNFQLYFCMPKIYVAFEQKNFKIRSTGNEIVK